MDLLETGCDVTVTRNDVMDTGSDVMATGNDQLIPERGVRSSDPVSAQAKKSLGTGKATNILIVLSEL